MLKRQMLKNLLASLLLGLFATACGGNTAQVVADNAALTGEEKAAAGDDRATGANDEPVKTGAPATKVPEYSAAVAVEMLIGAGHTMRRADCRCSSSADYDGDIEACVHAQDAELDDARACMLSAAEAMEAEFGAYATCMETAATQFDMCMIECQDPNRAEGVCESALVGAVASCYLAVSDELRAALGEC